MMHRVSTVVLLSVCLACYAAAQTSKAPAKAAPSHAGEYRGVSPGVSTSADVRQKLGQPDHESEGVSRGTYEGLRLMTYEKPPTSVFLDGDRVLLIIVVPDDSSPLPRTLHAWKERHRASDALPSFRDRNALVHVDASAGVAAHALDDQILAIEMFASMKVEDYQARLYKTPPHPRR